MMEKTFIKACRELFGYKTGEGLKEFAVELKELSQNDRRDLIAEFDKIGIKITAPPPVAV